MVSNQYAHGFLNTKKGRIQGDERFIMVCFFHDLASILADEVTPNFGVFID